MTKKTFSNVTTAVQVAAISKDVHILNTLDIFADTVSVPDRFNMDDVAIWQDDNVHFQPEVYHALAQHFLSLREEVGERPPKRPRLESIVPPATNTPTSARPVPLPAWLSGRVSSRGRPRSGQRGHRGRAGFSSAYVAPYRGGYNNQLPRFTRAFSRRRGGAHARYRN